MKRCKFCKAEREFYYSESEEEGRDCRFKCGSVRYKSGEYYESASCLRTQAIMLKLVLSKQKGANDV